jgi:hypothetical protein
MLPPAPTDERLSQTVDQFSGSGQQVCARRPISYSLVMVKRTKWQHMVMASRAEALTAVEIHNSPLSLRPLEGFLVHMHIAWLYLLHGEFEMAGTPFFYTTKSGSRIQIDG